MSSYLGARAFSHEQNTDVEAEYDRLRDAARHEAQLRGFCFEKSRAAYERGDGKLAHELSEQGKVHGGKMQEYNKQASEYIFRENNANGRVSGNTIDLHGQYVEEAEDILEERIKYARSHGQRDLHVIVGKGNHSANHVQKLKPAVERVCRDLGLQYHTEENAGRIYINLTGGPAEQPPTHGHAQPHHPHPQPNQHGPSHHAHAEPTPKPTLESMVLKKLEKMCCVVM